MESPARPVFDCVEPRPIFSRRDDDGQLRGHSRPAGSSKARTRSSQPSQTRPRHRAHILTRAQEGRPETWKVWLAHGRAKEERRRGRKKRQDIFCPRMIIVSSFNAREIPFCSPLDERGLVSLEDPTSPCWPRHCGGLRPVRPDMPRGPDRPAVLWRVQIGRPLQSAGLRARRFSAAARAAAAIP